MLEILSSPPKKTLGNSIYFISLGCPRNRVDTEVMLGILLKAGYGVSETLEEADYIVINTCGFLESAREEGIETIQEVYDCKKKGAKVLVTGCMVQSHKQVILDHFPNVDGLLGSGDVGKVLEAIRSHEPTDMVSDAKSYLEAGEVPRTLSTPNHYAYLKIAEGCKKRCSYCIIPQIKGGLKSKPIEQIVKEFNALLQAGVKEVILIAQDLGDWGKDLGYKRSLGLVEVLKKLGEIPGEFWIRLLYLYPDEITEELIEVIKNDPRICRYLDMPIQHVNDQMLKAMHRKTTKDEIYATVKKVKEQLPNMTLRTSLIVGFPGETEQEFKELKSFVKEGWIDHIGIFPYSKEPGSFAAMLPDQIDEKVKLKRQRELAKIQLKNVEKMHRKTVGKVLRVLVEGYHPETDLLMYGRTEGQCPEIDGMVIINDGRAVTEFGTWYPVEITEIAGYDLVGRVLPNM